MKRTAFSIALAAEMFVMAGAAHAQQPSPSAPPSTPGKPVQPADVTKPERALDPAERERLQKEWEGLKKEWEKATPEQRLLSVVHAKNLHETELGRLAEQRGMSQAVKDYGTMMVKEHTEGDAKLTSLASSENITLWEPARTQRTLMLKRMFEKGKDGKDGKDKDRKDPARKEAAPGTTEPRPADADAREARDGQGTGDPNARWRMPEDPVIKLRSLSGDEFDRAFARAMHHGHNELLGYLDKARSELTNDKVKTLASEVTGMVRHHRDEAAKLPGAKDGKKDRDEKPKTTAPEAKEPAMKDPHWDR